MGTNVPLLYPTRSPTLDNPLLRVPGVIRLRLSSLSQWELLEHGLFLAPPELLLASQPGFLMNALPAVWPDRRVLTLRGEQVWRIWLGHRSGPGGRCLQLFLMSPLFSSCTPLFIFALNKGPLFLDIVIFFFFF